MVLFKDTILYSIVNIDYINNLANIHAPIYSGCLISRDLYNEEHIQLSTILVSFTFNNINYLFINQPNISMVL